MEISRRVHKILYSPAILHNLGLMTIDLRDIKQKWKAPNVSWVKLNFDGACQNGGFQTAHGGVIRNYASEWINGYLAQTYSSDILEAKLTGIYIGLLITKKMNMKKIYVESDYVEALSFVKFECPSQHPCF